MLTKQDTLIKARKKSRIYQILLKTIYRRKNAYWVSKYLKDKNMFHNMGDNVYYGTNIPSDPFMISIGNNVTIAFDVTFITHDIFNATFDKGIYKDYINYSAYYETIEVGDNVAIGGKATIMPGVKIGGNSIIAGCSVVTKDVEAGTIVGGNPAKVIGYTKDLIMKRYNSNLPNWSWTDTMGKIDKYYWD